LSRVPFEQGWAERFKHALFMSADESLAAAGQCDAVPCGPRERRHFGRVVRLTAQPLLVFDLEG
jgi:hypothetical protein